MRELGIVKYIRYFCTVVIFVVFFASSADAIWFVYHKPSFKGRVVDAESKEPIEGAAVVACYYKVGWRFPSGPDSYVINAKEVLTDKNGEFRISSYTTLVDPFACEGHTDFVIYKPGYGSWPGRPINPLGYFANDKVETYFLNELGSEGKIYREKETVWIGERQMKIIVEPVTFTYGIVALPRLKTREERIRALPSLRYDFRTKKLPLTYELINQERKHLGFREHK